MDIKTIPAVIVGVMVALVLVGATMPIWADTLATEDTFKNEGYYNMVYAETDGELTAFWDHTKPHQITINGTDIALPENPPSFNLTIIAGDDWVVRYAGGNNVSVWGSSGGAIGASVENSTDLTITASSGSMTATNTATTPDTKTLSYTSIYYVSDDGLYVMKDQNTRAYVLKDSPIHAIGMTYLGAPISTSVQCIFDGTVGDGITGEVNRAGEGATITDITLDSSTVNNYNDLYSIGSITATVTNTSGSVDVNYSVYMVPAEITADRSVSMSGALGALVSIIPLLIIAGLVIGAVTWFMLRKG